MGIIVESLELQEAAFLEYRKTNSVLRIGGKLLELKAKSPLPHCVGSRLVWTA